MIPASKCNTTFTQLLPSRVAVCSVDYSLERHHFTNLNMTWIFISKLAWPWSHSASVCLLDTGPQLHIWVHSISARSSSQHTSDLWVQIHLQPQLVTSSQWIPWFPRFLPLTASVYQLHYGLQVNLNSDAILAIMYFSNWLNNPLQVNFYLPSTTLYRDSSVWPCPLSASRLTVCIYIDRYR